jgi:small subunit ribosomal protein S20
MVPVYSANEVSHRQKGSLIKAGIRDIVSGLNKDMAITKNAKRANRVSTRQRVVNDRVRRTMKEEVKNIRKDIASKEIKVTKATLSLAYKALDKAAKKGVIKKGTASRKKARLAKALAKVSK